MSKGFIALLAFTIALLAAVPSTSASQSASTALNGQVGDWQTKVLQDSKGNVHVLWLVPALNKSSSGPGIWYSKYSPNGTDTISAARITNSSTIQSADLAIDSEGNAVIVWADDSSLSPSVFSALYLLHFNSTHAQSSQVLTRRNTLVLWPSLALGYNDTIFMSWTEYNPTSFQANVEYGRMTLAGSIQILRLASYARADAFPPQANLVFDNATQHLQIAWGESGKDEAAASTVNYAKLGANDTILTQLQVARLPQTLRQVTMMGMDGNDGAFVVWQTTGSNYSLYVSQISPRGDVVYVKQLPTNAQSRYLAVADRGDSLYIVWYQPSAIASQNSTSSATTGASNMTYVRMSVTGTIDESGSGTFRDPIIGVAVLSDGAVYGVSPDGLVSVVTPTQKRPTLFGVAAMALMGCIGIAGLAGSVMVDEGRYHWGRVYSRFTREGSRKRSLVRSGPIVSLLGRKPGLTLRQIKKLTENHHPVGVVSLLRMESDGELASFRDGLSRRFYVRTAHSDETDALRTRILLWIKDHPGVWEAQLAKDLALSQQIVHYHLKKLRDARLVTADLDPDGGRKFYKFADDGSADSRLG